MAKKKGLSAREVLEGVYNLLKKKFKAKEIKLPKPATAEVGNDSDWHRTRIGYIKYEKFLLLKLNSGKAWIISLGTVCGDYPANRYDCDLAAIPISKKRKIAHEGFKLLKKNSYFKNSIIFSLYTGELAVKENTFGRKIIEILGRELDKFIAKEAEIDHRYFNLDFTPVVKSPLEYKPKLIDFLSEIAISVLSS